MALEMKKECEKCGRALPKDGEAFHLHLRMHLLSRLRGIGEFNLSKLRRRAGSASTDWKS